MWEIHRRLSEKNGQDKSVQMMETTNIKYPLVKRSLRSKLPMDCHNEHRVLQFKTFEVSNKRPDNCCLLTDGTIIFINHIAFRGNVIVVIGCAFLNKEDIQNYPCSSSKMHIYKIKNLSPPQIWPAEQISRKLILITFQETQYTIPLLHH